MIGWDAYRIMEQEDERLLSDALRKELIVYMTEGITTSVERASTLEASKTSDFPLEEIHALHRTTAVLSPKAPTSRRSFVVCLCLCLCLSVIRPDTFDD